MPPSKIMLIRHAEKQPDDPPGPPPYGINANGKKKRRSLTVRGWQRAGALVPFFCAPKPPIETPDFIYASAVTDDNDETKSRRPQDTVTPLARRLGIEINAPYTIGQEAKLATDIQSRAGVVLVAWEHKHIPLLAAALSTSVPGTWPDDRFDVVWILTAQRGAYFFAAVNQSLLQGDV
jgi:broad specificity phosphatase PhoE